jgi:hypothetical protein
MSVLMWMRVKLVRSCTRGAQARRLDDSWCPVADPKTHLVRGNTLRPNDTPRERSDADLPWTLDRSAQAGLSLTEANLRKVAD